MRYARKLAPFATLLLIPLSGAWRLKDASRKQREIKEDIDKVSTFFSFASIAEIR